MRRRRRRQAVDGRALPFALIAVVLIVLWAWPSLAFVAAGASALAACGIWYASARERAAHLRRWATTSNLYQLTPEGFEHHVADTYQALGYAVTVTPRIGDQGIDVIAERSDERLGLQCKRTTETVSNGAVQEAYAGKAYHRCTSAAVISLGGFTASARALAVSTGIALIDAGTYSDLFHKATTTIGQRSPLATFPTMLGMMRGLAFAAIAAIALAIGVLRLSHPTTTFQVPQSSEAIQPRVDAPTDVVERFYRDITNKDYAAAYGLLSPSFTRSLPYRNFLSGYSTTVSVFATTSLNDPRTVNVRLTATDRNRDGSYRTTKYQGYWRVVPDGRGSWLLEDGRFHTI